MKATDPITDASWVRKNVRIQNGGVVTVWLMAVRTLAIGHSVRDEQASLVKPITPSSPGQGLVTGTVSDLAVPSCMEIRSAIFCLQRRESKS